MTMNEILELRNPWEVLRAARELDLADRAGAVFEHFIGLLVPLPLGEKEALVDAQKDVFKVPVVQLRDEVRRRRDALLAELIQVRATVVLADQHAEMAYHPDRTPPLGYVLYRWDDNGERVPEWVDHVKARPGGATAGYRPPSIMSVCESGALALPTGIEEYGGDTALLKDLASFFTAYMEFEDPGHVWFAAGYTMYTWVSDLLPVAVYLRLIGDWNAGKSTLLNLLAHTCYRGLKTVDVTGPALFRFLAKVHCTFLLDEGDYDKKSEQWQVIDRVLLGGYRRGWAVLRTGGEEGDDGDIPTLAFTTFGPKVVAARRPQADTALESRFINIVLRPHSGAFPDHIPAYEDPAFFATAATLRNKLLLWRFRTYRTFEDNPRWRIPGVENLRTHQLVLPLLATVAWQEPWRELLIDVARRHELDARRLRGETLEGLIARLVVQEFRGGPSLLAQRRIRIKALADAIKAEGTLDYPLSQKRISALVKALGLRVKVIDGYQWIDIALQEVQDLAGRYDLELTPGEGGVA